MRYTYRGNEPEENAPTCIVDVTAGSALRGRVVLTTDGSENPDEFTAWIRDNVLIVGVVEVTDGS